MAHDPLDHVMDTVTKDGEHKWVFFDSLFGREIYIDLPKIFGLQITKFMVLELLAAGLILAIYLPIARRARDGALPRGRWWNCFESVLTFIRNEIAKPNLDRDDHGHRHGHHGEEAHGHHAKVSLADRYTPFLWTLFLFILFCNLMGMLPIFGGSPTASIYVTGALAVCSFLLLHGSAVAKMGPVQYLKSLWPNIEIDMPFGIGLVFGWVISGMIWFLELMGTVIKGGVLAIRLFANMFAGHMVLAFILLFIVNVGHANIEAGKGATPLWFLVTASSVLGVAALSLLELFVAFLQAYVFTFLTALFMGMALHPEH